MREVKPDQQTYERIQTKDFMSHEDEHPKWVAGQLEAVGLFFQNEPPEAAVLDIGCGDGLGLEFLEKNGFHALFGADLSADKLARARTRTKADLRYGDAHALPYEAETFDVVYSSHALEHCHDPGLAVDEARRVLRPGGRLFIVVPYPDRGDPTCHCGSSILRTRDNQGSPAEVLSFFEQRGFRAASKPECRGMRQPEIWLRLVKV